MKRFKFIKFAKVSLSIYSILLISCGVNNLNNKNKQMFNETKNILELYEIIDNLTNQNNENKNLPTNKLEEYNTKKREIDHDKLCHGYCRKLENSKEIKLIPSIITEIILKYYLKKKFKDYKANDQISFILNVKYDIYIETKKIYCGKIAGIESGLKFFSFHYTQDLRVFNENSIKIMDVNHNPYQSSTRLTYGDYVTLKISENNVLVTGIYKLFLNKEYHFIVYNPKAAKSQLLDIFVKDIRLID